MMTIIITILFVVLFLAWKSYANQESKKEKPLIYMQGENVDDDSDADMQEQYKYINHTEQNDKE